VSTDVTELDFQSHRVEELERFHKQRLKEDQENALERTVRANWCVEIFEATEGKVGLPWSVNYGSEDITIYHDWPMKEVTKANGEVELVKDYGAKRDVNVHETNNQIARIMQFARSKGLAVEKKYDESYFRMKITLHQVGDEPSYKDVVMTYSANRKAVCTAVTKTVHHEAKEAYDEETTEWICEPISFLGMDVD